MGGHMKDWAKPLIVHRGIANPAVIAVGIRRLHIPANANQHPNNTFGEKRSARIPQNTCPIP